MKFDLPEIFGSSYRMESRKKRNPSEKQSAAQKKFASNVKEAKRIRDKDPNIKMSKAVSMAYSRDRPRKELRRGAIA